MDLLQKFRDEGFIKDLAKVNALIVDKFFSEQDETELVEDGLVISEIVDEILEQTDDELARELTIEERKSEGMKALLRCIAHLSENEDVDKLANYIETSIEDDGKVKLFERIKAGFLSAKTLN